MARKAGRRPFMGAILKDKVASSPDVASYDGKALDITGTVKLYHGSAEVVLNSPSQISAK